MNCPNLEPPIDHLWREVRPGVRYCLLCGLWEYDVCGNVITFPVGQHGFELAKATTNSKR